MDLAERLKESRRERGLTQAQLAAKAGVSQQTISKLERRKIRGSQDLAKIAAALRVDALWLQQGKEAWPPTSPTDRVAHEASHLRPYAGRNPNLQNVVEVPQWQHQVPVINWVQAGTWSGVAEDWQPEDGDDLVSVNRNVGPRAFALVVRGDSMTSPHGKTFPDGTVIVVDPDKAAENGSYVVARLEDQDEATFKRLVVDGGMRFLQPLNPQFPTIPLNGRDAVICGVVVQAQFDV